MKLHMANESNVETFDGMHEGVVILSQSTVNTTPGIMFCNKPAKKLIHEISDKVAQVCNRTSAVLSKDCFDFVQLGESTNRANLTSVGPRSIEQIVIAQRDEPEQNHCVYKFEAKSSESSRTGEQSESIAPVHSYYQIRVKSVQFCQKPATAVYFYDLSSHVTSLQLSKKLLKQVKKNASLTLSQMTLSHEFRSPLTSILMLLQSMLQSIIDEQKRRTIILIISQINLLICLVNDILDMKMIEQGKFVTRNQRFNPIDTFKFIMNIFAQQAGMQQTDLSFHIVPLPLTE